MNIALFASAFHPHIGGVEELARQLAHQQRRQGDNPLVITNRWPKDLPAVEDFEGLPVRRYVFRVPEHTVRQMGGALLYGSGTLRELCADLREHRTEVIHVQCVSSNAYYALQAKRRLKLPLVVTLQGELTMDASRLFERSAFARKLMQSVLAEADAITACSEQTLVEAEIFAGKPFGTRARVIYNGIRLDDFDNVLPYPHARPYLLGIGRHVPQKGFDVLLSAFAEAIQSGETRYDLILAGDGVERPKLETQAAELKIADRVLFTGRVDHAAAVRLFVGCAFFVLPSRHEPMGIVNLEAMAAKKALVASNVGGVPELVQDGCTGLLVPGDDTPSLAKALIRLCRDDTLRRKMGEAGFQRAQQFAWPRIAEQYAAVYEDACVAQHGPIAAGQGAG